MKCSYKIRKSVYNDAWNWWNACNSFSHGVTWKNQINENLANKLVGTTQKEANRVLIPFLKKVYIKEKKNLSKAKKFFEKEFVQKFEAGCDKIEKVIKQPIYRKNFIIYLTTLRRGPYYKAKGIVWICIYWDDPIRTFLHELCHFQFIHYWRENPDSEVSKLTRNQFEYLKESLTMILDEDFFPIIKKPDYGYDLHQDFRKKLKKFWKKEKDFDKLVEFGIEKVRNYLQFDSLVENYHICIRLRG